jgi:hypothetical protein
VPALNSPPICGFSFRSKPRRTLTASNPYQQITCSVSYSVKCAAWFCNRATKCCVNILISVQHMLKCQKNRQTSYDNRLQQCFSAFLMAMLCTMFSFRSCNKLKKTSFCYNIFFPTKQIMYHRLLLLNHQRARPENIQKHAANTTKNTLMKIDQYRMSWLLNLGVVGEEHRRIVQYTTRSLLQRISGSASRWIDLVMPRRSMIRRRA